MKKTSFFKIFPLFNPAPKKEDSPLVSISDYLSVFARKLIRGTACLAGCSAIGGLFFRTKAGNIKNAVHMDFPNGLRENENSVNTDRANYIELDVHITEHCNLNCKGCCHFAPLAKNDFLSSDEFERDISKLSEILNHKIRLLQILGGEPLLHPDITSFFPIARKNFPDSSICIVTNGILLGGMNAQFWRDCHKYEIMVYISKYPIDIHIEAVKTIAGEYGVTIMDTPWGGWHKISLDLNGGNKDKCTYNFNHCFGSRSTTLKHGKIFNCFVMAHIEYFNEYFDKDLKPEEDDVLDIYKTKSCDELKEFLGRPKNFCKYCKTPFKASKWSRPSEQDINEWT